MAFSTSELLAEISSDTTRRRFTKDQGRIRKSILKCLACTHLFRPADLARHPVARELKVIDPTAYIMGDIIPAVGWSEQNFWTLTKAARREAVALHKTREDLLLFHQAAKIPVKTEVQAVLDSWLHDDLPPLKQQTAAQLTALRTLVDWGFARFSDFPNALDLERAWRRRALFADFEILARDFVGREDELQRLHAFMDDLSPRGSAMMICGVGGVGKSALVSRFILDVSERYGENPPPFIYLALDDPAVNPSEPQSLIAAALTQLELQIRDGDRQARYAFSALKKVRTALNHYARWRRSRKQRGSDVDSQQDRLSDLRNADRRLDATFANTLAGISRFYGNRPLLFVIDTFEEATFRPPAELSLLYEMLDSLLRGTSSLRLLLVGRARPNDIFFPALDARQLVLGDLRLADARRLLMRHGLSKKLANDAIIHFGSNPLTLKLLAHSLANGDKSITSVSLASAGESVIRGYLYRRILDHIHDPLVRQLAHPGMVLRRVTPDVISGVLLPACNLAPGNQTADVIFDKLAREHTLVGRAPDGALIYREEIRRPMMKLIELDQPNVVQELHERAAWFYSHSSDDTSREEELYHRLMGRHPDEVGELGARYFPRHIASRLVAFGDELPPRGRITLSRLTNFDIRVQDYDSADLEDRDRIIAQAAYSALRANDYVNAEMALNVNIEPGSVLAPLRVRVLTELGHFEEAIRFARSHIDHFPPFASRVRLAELMWFLAQASPPTEAAAALRDLVPVAESLSALTQVQVLTALTMVFGDGSPYREKTVADLANSLRRVSMNDVAREGRIIRLALVQVGPGKPDLWQRLGAETIEELPGILFEQRESDIGYLIDEVLDILAESMNRQLRLMTRDLKLDSGPRRIYRLSSAMSQALRETSAEPQLLSAVWTLFRAERISLKAASLAGLDKERDSWERRGPLEAAL
ncbi:AAA family ATPase [Sinorhizobium medicae]|nr:AAA family ATPase [Sinorhizobium medicae]